MLYDMWITNCNLHRKSKQGAADAGGSGVEGMDIPLFCNGLSRFSRLGVEIKKGGKKNPRLSTSILEAKTLVLPFCKRGLGD